MEVYAAALIIFLDKNWDTFLKYCGSQDFADETIFFWIRIGIRF